MRRSKGLTTWARIAGHAVLFLVAFVVFFLGLGIGLQVNPNLGTAMWIASAVLVALNVWWMSRAGRNKETD